MSVHWRSRIAPFLTQEEADQLTGARITTQYHREMSSKCGVGLARYLQMRAAEICLRQFAREYPKIFETTETGMEGEARTVLEIQKAFRDNYIDESEFKKRLSEYLSGKLSRHLFQKEQNKKETNEDEQLSKVKDAFRKALAASTLKWIQSEFPFGITPFDHFAVCHSRRGIELLGVSFEIFGHYDYQKFSDLESAMMHGYLDAGWIIVDPQNISYENHATLLGIAAFDGEKIWIHKRPEKVKLDRCMNEFLKRLIDLYRRI